VVGQTDEKFKNKKQVLFGGVPDQVPGKMSLNYNQVSSKILSYIAYLHEAKSFLRLVSRTAFIMTYDESMFTSFVKFEIELPCSYLNQFTYASPMIERSVKFSSKLKTIGTDMHDVKSMRLCNNIQNLAQNTTSLTRLVSPMGSNSNLSDLDESHDLIQVL